ncbi:Transcriptional regulator PadR-like family protein [Micromonospora viridifaciens]|uniref:Transcriptional regulator PadR-like family protein n=2 Tax=Micromonospora viridifaciens TaxID=1881 RepID=A0A1C4YAL2_MICVI|nr:Transcriptional regulator PadR-like family protein [Micromonospora viridifaciens]
MTVPRLLVLEAFLDEPECERYGLELAHLAGLAPGTIYPILVAFEAAGWLTSRAEEVDIHLEGRPQRRYYRLTASGVTAGRAAVAARKQRTQRAGARRLAW